MSRLWQYFQEVIQELKKVSWPTRKQTINLTALVIGATLIAALYIGGLDYVFQNAVAFILQR